MRYLCIHGHFYQPPRENPWTEEIEVQDEAYPYHDWNERISAECYSQNGASRVLDGQGRVARIINNYARISFNFGPTLLSWLERRDPATYQAVVTADAESRRRYSGHGSAMAQCYNHLIMPLASAADRRTQVIWGLTDFEHRFGRRPEGMWLPETAVDTATLEELARRGILFTVLAPHQVRGVRPRGGGEWRTVPVGGVDTTQPYLCPLPSGRSIAVFFYAGPLSQAVAFERLLGDGENFARRLTSAAPERPDRDVLIHIATDGETYGHHHRFGDMALSYALEYIRERLPVRLTNYGEYLASHPPEWEAAVAENTSWSCPHGVERWRGDCGCATGAHPGWSQAWRSPLRRAMNRLREAVDPLFESLGGELFVDPWEARDDYITVILDRSPGNVRQFLEAHRKGKATPEADVQRLQLLEMQRHGMLMFTSCGWFFDDLAEIGTVQVLRYAGRVIQLAEGLGATGVEEEFLRILQEARSNAGGKPDGRRLYLDRVLPARLDLAAVGGHYAVSSLFTDYPDPADVYCYRVARRSTRTLTAGKTKLVLGEAAVTSQVTGESGRFVYAALHLGDHNVAGGVARAEGFPEWERTVSELVEAYGRADLLEAVRVLDRRFAGAALSLQSLVADERRAVLTEIMRETLDEADQAFSRIYEENAPLMRFLRRAGIPVPAALRLAAERSLNRRLEEAFALEPVVRRRSGPNRNGEAAVAQVERLLGEVAEWEVKLDEATLAHVIKRSLERRAAAMEMWVTWAQRADSPLAAKLWEAANLSLLESLTAMLEVTERLPFRVDLWKLQNLAYDLAVTALPTVEALSPHHPGARRWTQLFADFAERLRVKPS